MNNTTLSVVILNYNTKELLKDCLDSLIKVNDEVNFEVIVVDNGSQDGSPEFITQNYTWVKLIETGDNLGFSKGNNMAREIAKGEYVLFLNTDTIVYPDALKKTVDYLNKNEKVGAITCKILLQSGELDRDARRSFPTPWVSLTHFSGLDKAFPKSKLFAKYWYGYLSEDEIHNVDVIEGAFFLTRKKVLDEVGWFDEDYFLDGEDIDLCYRIKEKGFLIVYYPEVSIVHIKGATKGKKLGLYKNLTRGEKMKFKMSGVDSMEIFYKKRLWRRYPLLVNILVVIGIKILKVARMLTT